MFPRPDGKAWAHVFPRSFSTPYAAALEGEFRLQPNEGRWLLGISTNYDLQDLVIAGLPQFAAPFDLPGRTFIPCLVEFTPNRLYTFTGTVTGGTVGTSANILTLLLGR